MPRGCAEADHSEAASRLRAGGGGAVVVTGGEPTAHLGLPSLLSDLKNAGARVILETNGSAPRVLDDVIGAMLVDEARMNVTPGWGAGRRAATGSDSPASALMESIDIAVGAGIPCELEVAAVPGIAGPDEIEAIAKGVSGHRGMALLRFDPSRASDPRLRLAEPYPGEAMRRMAAVAKRHVRDVRIYGLL
jgi:pyruvate formate lyase activating enzyme